MNSLDPNARRTPSIDLDVIQEHRNNHPYEIFVGGGLGTKHPSKLYSSVLKYVYSCMPNVWIGIYVWAHETHTVLPQFPNIYKVKADPNREPTWVYKLVDDYGNVLAALLKQNSACHEAAHWYNVCKVPVVGKDPHHLCVHIDQWIAKFGREYGPPVVVVAPQRAEASHQVCTVLYLLKDCFDWFAARWQTCLREN